MSGASSMVSIPIIATRRSKLALAQSREVAADLVHHHKGLEVGFLPVETKGDQIRDRPLQDIGGKGLFVKEIEHALLRGDARLAVHSVKDLPGELAPGLVLACIPKREDPRDAFVSRSGCKLSELPRGAHVGTSSMRRRCFVSMMRPDLRLHYLRGNVDTRIRKVRGGQSNGAVVGGGSHDGGSYEGGTLDGSDLDGAVLAMAGLVRLGMASEAAEVISTDVILPAVGQGALGIECREDDHAMREILSVLHDPETAVAVAVERGVMIGAGGSCRSPLAVHACRDDDNVMWLRAFMADAGGSVWEMVDQTMDWPAVEVDALELGVAVGVGLRESLARRFGEKRGPGGFVQKNTASF